MILLLMVVCSGDYGTTQFQKIIFQKNKLPKLKTVKTAFTQTQSRKNRIPLADITSSGVNPHPGRFFKPWGYILKYGS